MDRTLSPKQGKNKEKKLSGLIQKDRTAELYRTLRKNKESK
jgi:hypothetical protein